MFRFLTLIAFIAGVLLFTHGAAQAQDQALPVAGPDEIIFVGEVPAPPGTDVWAFYFVSEFFSCGHTTADESSRFVLVVDADCATPLGPSICWGDLPDWQQGPEELCDGTLSPVGGGNSPGAGETVDMGLLGRTLVPGPPDPFVNQPIDGYPRYVEFPVAGPDEIIYIGEAPALPGTQIRAEYLSYDLSEPVICGSTIAEERSNFVLAVDAACASNGLGPLICWAPGTDAGTCGSYLSSPLPGADRPEGGDTIDLGPLVPNADRETGLSTSILPNVGSAIGGGDSSDVPWLVLVVSLVLAGLVLSAAGVRLGDRRRYPPRSTRSSPTRRVTRS